jgi:hypothetical protein
MDRSIMNVTEQVIEELMAASFSGNTNIREKYFLRESLYNLVRLAKAEQLQEMRMDVAKVVCPVSTKSSIFAAPQ